MRQIGMYPVVLTRLDRAGEEVEETFYLKQLLPRSGKQGILGILARGPDGRDPVVFKISQYLNYTCRQENLVMEDLEAMEEYCPHFCKTYGIYQAKIVPNFREAKNPFDVEKGRVSITVDVLLMEFIEGAHKYSKYTVSDEVEDEVVFSVLKQVMAAVAMAQDECQLVHYDLHSNNILMTRTDPGLLHYYIMEDGSSYLVPTYGFHPTIIDYGFSYSEGLNGHPLYGALAHTSVGFMSSCYDDVGDAKILLCTLSWELENYRGKRVHKRFRRQVAQLLAPLDLDLESGWDQGDELSASDFILSLIEPDAKESAFFDGYGHYASDILQYLIDLPLKPRNIPELYNAFQLVKTEFMKLEKEIGSHFFLLYIFKRMVEAVAALKEEYLEGDEKAAIGLFRQEVYQVIDSVAKYAHARLDYERLFVGLLGMARSAEGMLYKAVESKMKVKEKRKKKMAVRRMADMLRLLYYTYQDDYDLDDKSTIFVFDQLRKTKYVLPLSGEDIEEYNSIKNLGDRNSWLFNKAAELD